MFKLKPSEAIHFILLPEVYIKRVQTPFGNIEKTSKKKKILSDSFGDRGIIIFQFVEVIGKQGVVAVTQRSFHHGR